MLPDDLGVEIYRTARMQNSVKTSVKKILVALYENFFLMEDQFWNLGWQLRTVAVFYRCVFFLL